MDSQNVEDCCSIPSILPPDALEACDNGIRFFIYIENLWNYHPWLISVNYKFNAKTKNQKQKKNKQKQTGNGNLGSWFNRIKNNFLPAKTKKSAKTVANRNGRQANQPRNWKKNK